MRRRGWGVLVIALTLIAVLAVPAGLGMGPHTGGQAVRMPIPPPPTVGQCLLSAVDSDGSAVKYAAVPIGSATIGVCTDGADPTGRRNHGEIVSVTADRRSFPSSDTNRTSTPLTWTCQPAATTYLGWPERKWAPWSTRRLVLIGPDIDQYLSGQQWIACAILPARDGYTGSIRGNPAGPAADAFGRCERDGAAFPERVACTEPHDIEVFGTATVAESDDVLKDSCARLVGAVTAMTDPTAGGRLEIRVDAGASGATPSDRAARTPAARSSCAIRVVGTGLLTASLVGRGARTLPWS